MANKVTGVVLGGAPQILDGVNTIGDVRKKMNIAANYEASVDGEPADNDYELDDYNHVSFAPAVKGGK